MTAALWLAPSGVAFAEEGEAEVVWKSNIAYKLAPAPAAADIDLDGRLEIILVDPANRVAVLDPSNGKALWETELELALPQQLQFTAAAGHFLGDGTIDVALVTASGHLLVLDGLTGQLIADYDLAFTPQAPPTIFPVASEPNMPENYRDGIAVLSQDGALVGYQLRKKFLPDILFTLKLPGIYKQPPAVGRTGWSSPVPHLAAVNATGEIRVMSGVNGARDDTHTITHQLQAGGRRTLSTWMALGDVTADGLDEIIVCDDSGYIHAFTIRGDAFEEVWSSSILSMPRDAPVLVDVNRDSRLDIFFALDRQFGLVNGATGATDIWNAPAYNHDADISSPAAPFIARDGRAYAVFSDASGRLNLFDIEARKLVMRGTKAVQLDVKTAARETPVVGSIRGEIAADAFVLGSRDGAGLLVSLGVPWDPAQSPWMGRHGGGWRTSGLNSNFAGYMSRQYEQLGKTVEANVQLAREANIGGDWTKAREHALEALAANPRHREARGILRHATVRENLFLIIVGVIIGSLVIGLAVWQGGLFAIRRGRLALVDRALAQDNKERAAELMVSVLRTAPKHHGHLKRLADLYVDTKQFSGKTAGVFVQAREAFPDDERYIKALATSYSNDRRRDLESAKAYADMVRVSSHPGPWAFILGQAYYEAGEHKQALEAFHKAVRHGYDDAVLPTYLSDLYVKLNVAQPEVLPTMIRVLDGHESDEEFLKVFCRACLEARCYDENALKAAQWLLKLDPKAKDAHVILASRLLQAGQVKDSLKHAEAVLAVKPDDSIGLRLMGACYAAEKRLDDTAMQIFNRALATNPDAHEILVAVSHGYIQEGREDSEAREIYIRALKGNPQEDTILKQVAKIAGKETNDKLTIQSVETLIDLGHRSRELVMQLAEAYCRQNVLTDKAEEIYREALLHQPDHATIAAMLATIYARKRRTDAEAMAIYESVYYANPQRKDIGRQLAFAYCESDLSDRGLVLANKLLAENPDDNELGKLAANAALALDQMDSAIKQYEQVFERNPEDAETICRLAHLYGKKRLSDPNAMKIFQRSIRIEPENIEFHAALARACVEKGNWEQVVMTIKHLLTNAPTKIAQAIAMMEELVEPTAKSINLRWFLIETLIYDGRLRDATRHLIDVMKIDPSQGERALSSYDRILDKNPRDARAHQQRGRILAQLGRDAEARHSLEQAYRHNNTDDAIQRDLMDLYQKLLSKRDSAEVRFQLGKLAMQAGKYDIAISCFQQTDKDYRWENESIRHLSRCFMAKGMLDLALQEIRRIPMDDEVKEILYELGQRYEAVNDKMGAREVYKAIFAADISYRDVKGKLEALVAEPSDPMSAERTAIINTLSESAKARYELIQELGRGAMGIVYKARDNELEEMVALKILPDTLGNNPEALRRFKQEARNARRLSHPNIVRIHDIGEELGRKYISMEFVDGTDLKARILETRRNVDFPETLSYAKQICEALAAAHDAGIVHRDIKPANIMLSKNRKVKVTDFGIAKLIEDDKSNNPDATRVGAVVGTPLYMSPEQVQGKPVDHRADLYSLGVMLYEMASGQPPFLEGDLAYHHVFTEPKPISRSVPKEFADIVMKCLSKKPEDRFQSAREILAELRKIQVPEELQ